MTITRCANSRATRAFSPCCGRGAAPMRLGFRLEDPTASTGNEMTLEVEAIVDAGMHAAAAEVAGAQPVENIWQLIRDNWLSNRVVQSYDDIVDHRGFAWNRLVDQPWTIMSIGLRNWAHRS